MILRLKVINYTKRSILGGIVFSFRSVQMEAGKRMVDFLPKEFFQVQNESDVVTQSDGMPTGINFAGQFTIFKMHMLRNDSFSHLLCLKLNSL